MSDETRLGALSLSQPASNRLGQPEPLAGPSQAPQPTTIPPNIRAIKSNNITYSNPREPTQSDFDKNFSKWFYGSIKKLKTRPKPRRQTVNLPRHWLRPPPAYLPVPPRPSIDLSEMRPNSSPREINETLEPQMHKYLTQDVQICDPRPIEEITTYRILARGRGFTEKHKQNGNIASLEDSEINTNNNCNQLDEVTTQLQDQSSLKNAPAKDVTLSLVLKSHRAIIDRRPMLKRQALCLAADDGAVNSSEVSSTSCLLIGPGEDCDESDGEFHEIDCDAA